MADDTLPRVKMWISGWRSCRHCNHSIRQGLMTDGARFWLDQRDRAWCTAFQAHRAHEPFPDVPKDPAALQAWLDE